MGSPVGSRLSPLDKSSHTSKIVVTLRANKQFQIINCITASCPSSNSGSTHSGIVAAVRKIHLKRQMN